MYSPASRSVWTRLQSPPSLMMKSSCGRVGGFSGGVSCGLCRMIVPTRLVLV